MKRCYNCGAPGQPAVCRYCRVRSCSPTATTVDMVPVYVEDELYPIAWIPIGAGGWQASR